MNKNIEPSQKNDTESVAPPYSVPFWEMNWEREITQLEWFRPMVGCKQDPLHHAEGDVAIHVRLVCEALINSIAWNDLGTTDRQIAFLGALLHDVAKPECTVTHEDGRITSLDHGRKGAQRVRRILWRGEGFSQEPPPLAVREAVSAMVRYSSLPLWLWDKDDPLRSLIRASQSVRLDLLALMSESDARGRTCEDFPDLLSRIQLFREYAQEHDCLHKPYAFSSAHSRYVYFNRRTDLDGQDARPTTSYAARDVFDDTRFEVTLMSGLPGAGKDRWIAENAEGLAVVSLDAIRERLKTSSAKDQSAVLRQAREEARQLMRREEPFIWNATNITRFMRDPLRRFFRDYGARIRIVYVEPPTYEELLRRNNNRENAVPEDVIERLAEKLEVPDLTEAHELLWVTS